MLFVYSPEKISCLQRIECANEVEQKESKRVRYIVRWKERGKRSREIAMELKISKRRVNRVWRDYKEKGEIPRDIKNIGRIRDLIIDNGCEFGAHGKDEKGNWNSEFKREVEYYGVKIITTRVNHPQTNGKIERLNQISNKFKQTLTIKTSLLFTSFSLYSPHPSFSNMTP